MTMKLHVIGSSYAEIDGKKLVFALRKAEAIIFYVALCGSVSRDSLKDIFWSDKKPSLASSNLRNAIYVIKSMVGSHLRVTRRNAEIINFSLDIDDYLKIADPSVSVPEAVCEEPLKDVDVTNSDAFDEWLLNTREVLKNKIALSVRKRISACYDNK